MYWLMQFQRLYWLSPQGMSSIIPFALAIERPLYSLLQHLAASLIVDVLYIYIIDKEFFPLALIICAYGISPMSIILFNKYSTSTPWICDDRYKPTRGTEPSLL